MAVPAARLADALAGLLARAGARTVRVVDGRTGTVVGIAGEAPGPDVPALVAALLREALPLGAGGSDDVTLVTGRGVHVLRTGPVTGVFVHLQLDPGADVARARSALADPGVRDAVRQAVAPVPTRSPTPAAVSACAPTVGPRPDGSAPARPGGHPSPDPRPPAPRAASGSTPGRQPALAVLVTGPVRTGDGARAVAALAELSRPGAAPIVLPRRRCGSGVWSVPAARARGSTAGLPERAWAGDPETLRRLADGLRRLS